MSSVIAPSHTLVPRSVEGYRWHGRTLICRSTQGENWSRRDMRLSYPQLDCRQSLTADQAQNRLTYTYSLGVLVLDYLIGAFLPVITSMQKHYACCVLTACWSNHCIGLQSWVHVRKREEGHVYFKTTKQTNKPHVSFWAPSKLASNLHLAIETMNTISNTNTDPTLVPLPMFHLTASPTFDNPFQCCVPGSQDHDWDQR